MGIPMGAPYFKIEKFARQSGVEVFSSNYALYGDMSRRIMQVLANFAQRLEVYSIDEGFLDLSGMPDDLTDYALGICRTVRQWTGIPVSIGIAPTKTLSKIANRLAKKGFSASGPVLEWQKIPFPDAVLEALPVEAIWGISVRLGMRLRRLGIADALALRSADPKRLRQLFGVGMERIVLELRGVPCISLETVPPARKQIMTSRSFGERLTELADLRAAVTSFAACSGKKLRAQGLAAQALCVFIHTSPFETSRLSYSNTMTIAFDHPSQDSAYLIHCAVRGLEQIFRPGYAYQRAGVLLLDLMPAGTGQIVLFAEEMEETGRSARLMETVDRINRAYGLRTLRFASEGLSEHWHMRQQLKSPSYTTNWRELVSAKC
ncbi:MAG: Y-family DNA polymerase [Methylomicrobium sp.]